MLERNDENEIKLTRQKFEKFPNVIDQIKVTPSIPYVLSLTYFSEKIKEDLTNSSLMSNITDFGLNNPSEFQSFLLLQGLLCREYQLDGLVYYIPSLED